MNLGGFLEIEMGNDIGVCVLLSAYKPDLKFFAEQLDSIDKQTFPLTLLVRNDCPESDSLERFIQAHITKNAYRYYHAALLGGRGLRSTLRSG